MNYRKSFWLMWALCVVGLLLLYLFVAVGHIAIAYAGVLCMLAGLGQTVKFFRCPYCGKLWRLRGGIPKECPYCGKFPGSSVYTEIKKEQDVDCKKADLPGWKYF